MTDFLRRQAAVPTVRSCGSADLDVTDREAVAACMADLRPDAVFHLAAKADTDWCEDHFEEAGAVNVDGALNVAEEGLSAGANVVHFSSACLYPDNKRPYAEDGEMAAHCRYTETKLEAEQALKPLADRVLIIRMRQPFSNHRHPRNLLQKLATYTDFIDEANSMSHLEECIPVVHELCRIGKTGPYNLTNPGWTTPWRIAGLIRSTIRPDMEFRKITYEDLLSRVAAPRVNSLVDCSKLEAEGFVLAPVDDAVVDCLTHPCDLGGYDWSRRPP